MKAAFSVAGANKEGDPPPLVIPVELVSDTL